MNTFTHILRSINWVDVAMLVLMIRIVFIGVKTGFVTELFKLFGVFLAVLIAFHYYTPLAVVLSKKTGISLESLECFFFILLASLLVIAVKYMREGFFQVFKFETTHAGVNQWGSGVFAIIRALFLVSIVLFGTLLSRIEWLERETRTSISSKLAIKAAPGTYSFVFNNVIGRIFTGERFNQEAIDIISAK